MKGLGGHPELAGAANATRHWFWRVMQYELWPSAPDRLGLVKRILRGKSKIDLLIEDAGLTGRLSDIVRIVTRRSRLWPSEKLDIARELVTHFQDGLSAGRPPESLFKDFGDPLIAARLLRRAAKRKRPLVWHVWLRGVQALSITIALLSVVYGSVALRFWILRPSIARNYAAEINAPFLSVPEGKRGWPLLRQASLSLEAVPVFEDEDYEYVDLIERKPGADHWEEFEAFLDRNRQTLELARAAIGRPVFGFILTDAEDYELFYKRSRSRPTEPPKPPSENPMVIGVLLPHLSELRQFAGLFCLEARRAFASDRADEATDWLIVAFDAADRVEELPIATCASAAARIRVRACDVFSEMLRAKPDAFSGDDLRRLQGRFEAMGRDRKFDCSGEQAMFEDLLQRAYTDDGSGDGALTKQGLELFESVAELTGREKEGRVHAWTTPLFAPVVTLTGKRRVQVRAEVDRLRHLFEDAREMPLWTLRENALDAELRRHSPATGATTPIEARPFFAWMTRWIAEQEIVAMQADATVVAIALEQHRRGQGSCPGSIQGLVPLYLSTVPVDRFTGQPLKYRLEDGSNPMLYSAGIDQDDDGGCPLQSRYEVSTYWLAQQWVGDPAKIAPNAEKRVREIPDGDWILWPPSAAGE